MTAENENRTDDYEDISEKKDRGILKKIIKKGNSDIKPSPGDTVEVHYVGTYFGGEKDGEKFDSSRDRNERFTFKIGVGDVIKAWDIGVATMNLGEVCELIAAPDYAYKDGKALKFEIEIFDTKGEDVSFARDGSITKSVIDKGRDESGPSLGFWVNIYYRCLSDPNDLTGRDVQYTLGDPAEQNVPTFIDQAVRQMKNTERCRLKVDIGKFTHNDSVGDSSDSIQLYDVKLKSREKVPSLVSLTKFEEQMEVCERLKAKANDYMKSSKYEIAESIYDEIERQTFTLCPSKSEDKKTFSNFKISIFLNMALAKLKLNDSAGCIEYCNQVLKESASNEKALFRMGQAYMLEKDHEQAATYFNRVINNNPNNTAAIRQLQICKEFLAKAKNEEKMRFRKYYERYTESQTEKKLTENASINEVEENCAS